MLYMIVKIQWELHTQMYKINVQNNSHVHSEVWYVHRMLIKIHKLGEFQTQLAPSLTLPNLRSEV